MKKSDVDVYHDGREALPSINVKVDDAWRWATHARAAAVDAGASVSEADAFAAWCEEHDDDEDLYWLFGAACESGWESAEMDAEEVLGASVKVEARGRSGGHLVVRGLPDVAEWDAIAVSRWSRFARYCVANVANVPHEMAMIAWLNVWLPTEEERAAAQLPVVEVV